MSISNTNILLSNYIEAIAVEGDIKFNKIMVQYLLEMDSKIIFQFLAGMLAFFSSSPSSLMKPNDLGFPPPPSFKIH